MNGITFELSPRRAIFENNVEVGEIGAIGAIKCFMDPCKFWSVVFTKAKVDIFQCRPIANDRRVYHGDGMMMIIIIVLR